MTVAVVIHIVFANYVFELNAFGLYHLLLLSRLTTDDIAAMGHPPPGGRVVALMPPQTTLPGCVETGTVVGIHIVFVFGAHAMTGTLTRAIDANNTNNHGGGGAGRRSAVYLCCVQSERPYGNQWSDEYTELLRRVHVCLVAAPSHVHALTSKLRSHPLTVTPTTTNRVVSGFGFVYPRGDDGEPPHREWDAVFIGVHTQRRERVLHALRDRFASVGLKLGVFHTLFDNKQRQRVLASSGVGLNIPATMSPTERDHQQQRPRSDTDTDDVDVATDMLETHRLNEMLTLGVIPVSLSPTTTHPDELSCYDDAVRFADTTEGFVRLAVTTALHVRATDAPGLARLRARGQAVYDQIASRALTVTIETIDGIIIKAEREQTPYSTTIIIDA
jgi:hypothetical protein